MTYDELYDAYVKLANSHIESVTKYIDLLRSVAELQKTYKANYEDTDYWHGVKFSLDFILKAVKHD